ncbi:MAG: NUDIX domain-containing protein [Nitrososphaerales archaeon]
MREIYKYASYILEKELVRHYHAVSCVIQHRRKILLLKRSHKVMTNKGLWSVVAGRVERDPLSTAFNEIEEETGLTKGDVRLLRRGRPLSVSLRKNTISSIHPFLFSTKDDRIRLNWEHEEFLWVFPRDVNKLDLVPSFLTMLASLGLTP